MIGPLGKNIISQMIKHIIHILISYFLGGYVGLLIGASALKLADFNGYLLDLCFGKCKTSEVLNEYPTIITIQTQDPNNVTPHTEFTNTHLPRRRILSV